MSSFFTSSRVVGFHCGIIDRKVKREREREREREHGSDMHILLSYRKEGERERNLRGIVFINAKSSNALS
jgi:hypothetical protein